MNRLYTFDTKVCVRIMVATCMSTRASLYVVWLYVVRLCMWWCTCWAPGWALCWWGRCWCVERMRRVAVLVLLLQLVVDKEWWK